MDEALEMEEDSDCPMSPNTIAQILGNLFRKESNGDPIDFFLRRTRIIGQPNKVELDEKLKKLKETVEKGGGCLWEEPTSPHSIELVFPELIDNPDDIDYDLFQAKFVEECYDNGELLDLEDFRLGKSPYNGSVKMNDIMKGLETWDSVRRQNNPQKGRKLPDFGMPIQTSTEKTVKSNISGKKGRMEYTIDEDLSILKFLIQQNLYDKVGGNTAWKIVHKEFPNHSYQSLQTRFRRFIFPNLHKYKGLRESERNLFNRGSLSACNESDSVSPSKKTKTNSFTVENAVTEKDENDSEKKKEFATNGQEKSSINENNTIASEKLSSDETVQIAEKLNNNEEISLLNQVDLSSPKVVIEESQLSSEDMEDTESVAHHRTLSVLSSSSTEPLFRGSASAKKTKNKPAIEFTVEEDKCILKYITENKKFTEFAGSKLWMDIRESVFNDEGRSWKSIKRRFQRVIMQDIESEKYALDRKTIRSYQKRSHLLKSSTSSEQNTDTDFNVDDFFSDSSRNDCPKKKSAGQRLYTLEEDKLIIKYIVKSNRFIEVRGKCLWVDIQDKVLYPYNRTWESAKTRFLKTIMRNLEKFHLKADIVEKFQLGAVAERNLGGARKYSYRKVVKNTKRSRVDEDSEEEVVKHPALATKKTSTPNKQPAKRKLYKQPIVPLPVVFSPQPGPSSAKKTVAVWKDDSKTKSTRVTEQKPSKFSTNKDFTNCSNQTLPNSVASALIAASPSVEATADNPSPRSSLLPALKQCSVIVRRLTQAELDKYGCNTIFIKTAISSPAATMLPPAAHPSPPPKCSRFTVEISPSLYAARMSTSGSTVELATEGLPTMASPDKFTRWLPLSSSLSRQCLPSIRKSNQTSYSSKNDEISSRGQRLTRSKKNAVAKPTLDDSPPSSPQALSIGNCSSSNDKGKSKETDIVANLSSLPIKPALPAMPKIAAHRLASIMRDDLSSDDYYSPTNTDGYYTPDG